MAKLEKHAALTSMGRRQGREGVEGGDSDGAFPRPQGRRKRGTSTDECERFVDGGHR